jgi:hypothetical protein
MVNKLELSGKVSAKPAVDWAEGVLKFVLSFDSFVIRVRATMPPPELAVAISSLVPGDDATITGEVRGSLHGIFCVADKIVTKTGWIYEKHTKMSEMSV